MKTMKKIAVSALTIGALLTMQQVVMADVVSLRGGQELTNASTDFTRKDPISASGGIERTWKLQPPSIPHKINNDRISLSENTCLNCHSAETYKAEKAPKIGDSHFVDADGVVHPQINMRRHFCYQCHVQQMDVNPLVENVFVGNK